MAITVMLFVLCSQAPAYGAEQGGSVPFFSQGQAVDNPQDRAGSQQLALRDFMSQGLSQAIGRYLSPAQIGAQYSDIQNKFLAQSSRYIDSYQVFSESQTNGLYKVVGQITVSMDLLRKDLQESGFSIAERGQRGPAAEATAAADDENDEEASGDADNAEGSGAAPAVDNSAPQFGATSRGLSVTKKEILWVVAEKWEQEWVLPSEQRDTRSLFATGMAKELGRFDFSIQLPQTGVVRMDLSGSVPPSQVISLAEGLGIQDAVVGTLSYKQDRVSKQAVLECNLRVIRISAGKSESEIRKTQSIEELSNQEGALELASRIAPQLSSLLGGTGAGKKESVSGPTQGTQEADTPSHESSGSAGDWTINFPSVQYPYWKELERVLRGQSKNMQITSLEMMGGEGTVKIAGVDGSVISKMNAAAMPSGATVKIDSYSVEARTVKLSFTPPGKGQ